MMYSKAFFFIFLQGAFLGPKSENPPKTWYFVKITDWNAKHSVGSGLAIEVNIFDGFEKLKKMADLMEKSEKKCVNTFVNVLYNIEKIQIRPKYLLL